MPSELQQNRYDQLIRRVGGIVGPGSKVAEALSELFPIIDVENLPAELYLLSGTAIGFGGSSSGPVAAEFSSVQLFNPVDSGKLVTVTQFQASPGATSVIRMATEAASRGTAVPAERFADTRLGVTALTTAQLFFASNVAETPNVGRFLSLGAENVTIQDPRGLIVLAPGTGFTLGNETANLNLMVSFWWRERVAEQSELNF